MGTGTQSTSPEPVVFRTAIGAGTVMTLATFCLSFLTFTLVYRLGGSVALQIVCIVGQVLSAGAVIVYVYLMLSTNYRLAKGVLYLRKGTFSRRIDLESISAIFLKHDLPTRGRVYGFGSEFVGIDYKGGSVSITPKDVDGFLAAIGACRTESGEVKRGALDRQHGTT